MGDTPSGYKQIYEDPGHRREEIHATLKRSNTPCEGEESIGPIYSAPSSDEQKIYEEFEGKRFHKLHHNDLM